jgi:Cu2+-containing amine oxidase
MSTLAEIEKAVPHFSAEELAELEQFVRKARRAKEQAKKPSLRDIRPVSVGQVFGSLGTRVQWHDEMLEGRV